MSIIFHLLEPSQETLLLQSMLSMRFIQMLKTEPLKSTKKVFWPRMHRIEHNIFYDVSHNKMDWKTLETLKTLYSQKDFHGLLLLKKGKNIESLKGLISKLSKVLLSLIMITICCLTRIY